MTEVDFWAFLNAMYFRNGRAQQVSAVIDSDVPLLNEAGRFLGGHAILPNGLDEIGREHIRRMCGLLLNGNALNSTKEAVMMILAHHPSEEALRGLEEYNRHPDKELKIFAEFALDECRWWNETS